MSKRLILFALAFGLCGLESGCISIGARRLKTDQVDYARALAEANKREILAMIVGLRYADAPSFVNLTTIIASYGLTESGSPALNLPPGGFLRQVTGSAGAGVTYSNNPTFTYSPTTGEAYANAYIRPLAPTLVLPLADSGIPIDLLLRVTAQSIGGLYNGTLLGGPYGNGSPEFFELLQVLRQLQLAGELTVQYQDVNNVRQVFLTIGATAGAETPEHADEVARVRSLLSLTGSSNEYEIVYGQGPAGENKISMVTRSILGILTDLGAEIHVPEADIASGATKSTVRLVGGETRSTIVVHVGKKAPADAYVDTAYRSSHYWIDSADFDSKYAFTVVQTLMALAEVNMDSSKAPVVTIPAN